VKKYEICTRQIGGDDEIHCVLKPKPVEIVFHGYEIGFTYTVSVVAHYSDYSAGNASLDVVFWEQAENLTLPFTLTVKDQCEPGGVLNIQANWTRTDGALDTKLDRYLLQLILAENEPFRIHRVAVIPAANSHYGSAVLPKVREKRSYIVRLRTLSTENIPSRKFVEREITTSSCLSPKDGVEFSHPPNMALLFPPPPSPLPLTPPVPPVPSYTYQ